MYVQSPSSPVDPSVRALSGRLEFTVRRHKFNEDSLLVVRMSRVARVSPDWPGHSFSKPSVQVLGFMADGLGFMV